MNKDIMVSDQEEFMLRGKQTVATYNEDQIEMYEDSIHEEYDEFVLACLNEPLENQVKECVDLIVVCIGFLFSLGIDPLKAWKLVWQNNIAKVTGEVEKDSNGKIKKSPESIARKAKMMEDIRGLF